MTARKRQQSPLKAPKRIHGTLADLCEALGETRQIAVCRELTKRFEEVVRGPLGTVCQDLSDRQLKGEIVLVIARGTPKPPSREEMMTKLRDLLKDAPMKAAAAEAASIFGISRRDAYQMALEIKDEG